MTQTSFTSFLSHFRSYVQSEEITFREDSNKLLKGREEREANAIQQEAWHLVQRVEKGLGKLGTLLFMHIRGGLHSYIFLVPAKMIICLLIFSFRSTMTITSSYVTTTIAQLCNCSKSHGACGRTS
jgi:hypothetical protein